MRKKSSKKTPLRPHKATEGNTKENKTALAAPQVDENDSNFTLQLSPPSLNDVAQRTAQKNIAVAQANMSLPSPVLYLNVGKPLRAANAKLTQQKRKEFLQALITEGYSISKAAHRVGVSNTIVYELMKTDPDFAQSVESVRNAYLDQAEYAGLKMAALPTREGFNDRKFFLTAYRRERYSEKVEVNVKHTVNATTAVAEIRELLAELNVSRRTGPGDTVVNANYRMLNEGEKNE